MDREEVRRRAAQIAVEGERYRYPAAVGLIKAVVTGDGSPFKKLRDIEIILGALETFKETGE
ncbi:MAG: hypothetical protein K0Q73_7610 [Paenibacillus sp.]|jgi:hypothetical protein|nr:hypothetical protein [Paenibacillus sp.]